MKRILIIGGANGIGLSIATEMAQRNDCEKIYVVDKKPMSEEYKHEKIKSFVFDITEADYSFFNQFEDIDSLMITAGFGKLALFQDIDEEYIIQSFQVNTIAVIRIIKHFYYKLLSKEDFYCGIIGSIAGFMSSPFFAIYGASKAALKIFIESVNVELLKAGTSNRILNVSPGSIKGTNFYQGKNDLILTRPLALEIIHHLEQKNDLFIPQYENIYKQVLERYAQDFRAEGIHSYEYKLNSNRK